jgi:hypothetical protein
MCSRRQNSETELSPRWPSSKILIFTSAEKSRRVLRLISFACLSAYPFGPVSVLISHPLRDHDEPQTPPLAKQSNLSQRP